jgi:hypothetical protein
MPLHGRVRGASREGGGAEGHLSVVGAFSVHASRSLRGGALRFPPLPPLLLTLALGSLGSRGFRVCVGVSANAVVGGGSQVRRCLGCPLLGL